MPTEARAATVADLHTSDLKLKGFKAYATDTAVNPVPTYSRRDFYKVALVRGHCPVHYADRSIELHGTNLLFTTHIAERVVGEAKALLHHTDWDVAAIGYGLGFEHASYSNNFFKQHTGRSPLAFRKVG